MTESQVIFIGGRSGVGKSVTAFALHDLLSDLDIRHAVIEGGSRRSPSSRGRRSDSRGRR